MAALPEEYRAVILDQQRQLAKLVQSAGIAPVRKLYQQMLEDLERRLRRIPAGTMTHMQVRGMLAQVKIGLAGVLRQMAGKFGDAAFQIGVASARHMLEDVAKLERYYTGALMPLPVLETARLHGLVHDETASLLRVHATSMARYGVELVGRMEMTLAGTVSTGESGSQAINKIMTLGDLEWWRAERIVRTELSYASNASARRANDEQAGELDGDLWARWSEHVSDDGVKLDDRVGVDSEAMNGQVAPPGGVFTQPPRAPDGEEVGESLVGKEWRHPPNRPNDRAVLVPWRFHWGIPGWIWKGRRVQVTAAMVEKANAGYTRKRAAPVELVTAAPVLATPTIARAPVAEAVQPSTSPTAPSAPPFAPPEDEPKNPKRVAAAKKAAEVSAERRREIHSVAKSNLPQELQVVWDQEGYRFMQQEAGRIRGIKDRVNAGSKLSEAFAEKYGSGAETTHGNEGDRFFKRAEIEAKHAESWADEQEQEYYKAAQAAAVAEGEIDERGELTELGRSRHAEQWEAPKPSDDDPPF